MASSKQAVVSLDRDANKEKHSFEGPPSGLTTTAEMKESNLNEFDDDDDELGGGLFSLDEEEPKSGTGKMPKRYNCDYESDAEDESDVAEFQSGDTITTGRTTGAGYIHTGALAYGTSLPVTIPAGRFWPPKDAVDSVKEKDGLLNSDDENAEGRVKTLLPQRIHKDLYREMQAQARSIQAADDPERLFGERPQRRRYQTGEASPVASRPLASHAPHDNAIVIVAASVSSHT